MTTARDIGRDAADLIKAPVRRSVFQCIAENLVTKEGAYQAGLSGYMREPADALASRKYKTLCFVGPARTSKTVTLIDGWVARNVLDDPGDMLIVQSTQKLAGDYSRFRIQRMIDESSTVRERMSPRKRDNNTFDKVLRSGSRVSFAWPSGSQLSSRDFRYVALTELDAAEEDIDGEGTLLVLASKRVETYLSRGMVMVESSPRRTYSDASWRRRVPHESPPATGILAVYNGGTMCWLHWCCEHCGEWMALDPDVHVMFGLPDLETLAESLVGVDAAEWARDHAHIACPSCHGEFDEARKQHLSSNGLWVPSGCSIIDGRVVGEPRDSQTISFHLSSVAAAYNSWRAILESYAVAIQDYARTGLESAIKSTVNLDQGRAHLLLSAAKQKSGHELQARAEHWPARSVPHGVRFLLASLDIQAGKSPRFEVLVMGYGVGLERWVVDRYALRSSERPDPHDPEKMLPIDPSSYVEDWHRLIGKVIDRRYEVGDGSGRSMPVRAVACDSGGKEGVTARAYEFWRLLRKRGLHGKFRLVKGTDNQNAARVIESFPDARGRADRNSGAAGDVPVLMLNTTMLKDDVIARVFRDTPGPGYFHFPQWLPTSFYDELTAETRGGKRWVDHGRANETFDLCVYADALAIHIGAEQIDWRAPPSWAAPWDQNPDVVIDWQTPKPPAPRRALVRSSSTYLRR